MSKIRKRRKKHRRIEGQKKQKENRGQGRKMRDGMREIKEKDWEERKKEE